MNSDSDSNNDEDSYEEKYSGERNDDYEYTGIRKLFPDFAVSFGDGGSANLDFPVYTIHPLPIANATQKRLKIQLRKVAELRKDVQPNGVVHDIVDPSLHARVLTDDEVREEIALLEMRNGSRSNRKKNGEEEYEQVKEKRGRFQWVPSTVRCTIPPETDREPKKLKSEDNREWVARWQSPIARVPERDICPQF